jgi:hypothetical protein
MFRCQHAAKTKACLTILGIFVSASSKAAESWTVEVRETAGIARFAYPVSTSFHATRRPAAFRLLDGDRELRSQFTRLANATSDGQAIWSVDFNVDLSPNETRSFTIESAAAGEAASFGTPGMRVEREPGKVRVLHPTLEFAFRENLQGLFEDIQVGGDDWLVDCPGGLVVYLKDGSRQAVVLASSLDGSPAAKIVKSGPLAVALEFAGETKLASRMLQTKVRFDLPLGKSWVRTDWIVEDPQDLVAGLAVELRLRLDCVNELPILADIGAGGWTYAALRPDEALLYRCRAQGTIPTDAEPRWQIDRVLSGDSKPYAASPRKGNDMPPQGWAHLMDQKRATAIAVDRFAERTDDSMKLGADGKIALRRDFARLAGGALNGEKRFTFWLHVVSSPPQVGAATSPQSMLAPPELHVKSR